MSFQILVQVLQILRELTIKLQLKAIDVVSAYKLVDKVVSTLKSMKTNSVSEFRKQFAEAARIAKKLHGDQFELTTPRISGRQRHRSNPPSSTAEVSRVLQNYSLIMISSCPMLCLNWRRGL